jgi:hypothetical protein
VQALGEVEFFAERYSPGFGGEEGIGAAFDDEITVIERNSVSSDLASPMLTCFEQGDLGVRGPFDFA